MGQQTHWLCLFLALSHTHTYTHTHSTRHFLNCSVLFVCVLGWSTWWGGVLRKTGFIPRAHENKQRSKDKHGVFDMDCLTPLRSASTVNPIRLVNTFCMRIFDESNFVAWCFTSILERNQYFQVLMQCLGKRLFWKKIFYKPRSLRCITDFWWKPFLFGFLLKMWGISIIHTCLFGWIVCGCILGKPINWIYCMYLTPRRTYHGYIIISESWAYVLSNLRINPYAIDFDMQNKYIPGFHQGLSWIWIFKSLTFYCLLASATLLSTENLFATIEFCFLFSHCTVTVFFCFLFPNLRRSMFYSGWHLCIGYCETGQACMEL